MDREKEDRTTARFPPPPSYYKSFTSSNSMSPPKITPFTSVQRNLSFQHVVECATKIPF